MQFLQRLIEIILQKHRQMKRLYRVIFVLSCVVVFITTYALILPAITIDRDAANRMTGMKVADERSRERKWSLTGSGPEESASGETVSEESGSEEKGRNESVSEEIGAEESEEAGAEVSEETGAEEPEENIVEESEETGEEESEEAGEEASEDTGEEGSEETDEEASEEAGIEESGDGQSGDGVQSSEEGETISGDDSLSSEEEDTSSGDDGQSSEEEETLSDDEGQPAEEEETLTDEEGQTSEEAGEIAPEEELITEETELTAKGSDYTVYATVTPEAKLPAGTVLQVREITKEQDEEEYQLYLDRAQEELQGKYDENTSVSFARFYDISFMCDGGRREPAGKVNIRIEYEETVEVTANAGLDTDHFDEKKEEKPEFIESELRTEDGQSIKTGAGNDKTDVESIKAAADSTGTAADSTGTGADSTDTGAGSDAGNAADAAIHVSEIEFESDRFSVYGVVGSTTIETKILTSDGHTYSVTVTCGAETGIPADARLEVSEVTAEDDGYASYLRQIADLMNADESSIPYVKLLDISILTGDGDKVVLNAPVDVQIRLLDTEELGESTQVVHFVENADDDAVEPELMENTAEGDTVSFQADSFSAYAIVQGPEAIPASDMWTKVTSLDELKEMASKGLYIGTTGGYYLTD